MFAFIVVIEEHKLTAFEVLVDLESSTTNAQGRPTVE